MSALVLWLCVAVIGGAASGDGIVTVAVRVKNELAAKASLVSLAQLVGIFKDGDKKELDLPAAYSIGGKFYHRELNRFFKGEPARNRGGNDHIRPIHRTKAIHWNVLWQAIARPKSEQYSLGDKFAAAAIPKGPIQRNSHSAVLARSTLQPRQSKLVQINVRLLSLRRYIGHSLLRLGRPHVCIGASLDGRGLSGNCSRLSLVLYQLPLRAFRERLASDGLPFHLLDLRGKSVRFASYLPDLTIGRIGLPFGLLGKVRDVLNGSFEVAGIAGDAVGFIGDNGHNDGDDRIGNVKPANPFPERILGWFGIVFGLLAFGSGYLWMAVAGREGLTLGDTGRRGLFAAGLVIAGLVIFWQAAPLVLP